MAESDLLEQIDLLNLRLTKTEKQFKDFTSKVTPR